MPIGIIVSSSSAPSLIAVSAVLNGMVCLHKINIESRASDAFRQAGLPWARYLISAGAVADHVRAPVMMLSQPRVWLAMARDGMVPESFFEPCTPEVRTP